MLRFATEEDLPFLKWMLYEACYPDPEDRPGLDRALAVPTIAVYLDGWVRKGDFGLVVTNEKNVPLGAAWYRRFTSEAPGYGFVDEDTPELVLALRQDTRGQGLGTQLLQALIQAARKQGHRRICLAVDHTNPGARRLYERLGFQEVGRDDEVAKMVLELTDNADS